ncbi:hypothetical protein ACFX2I_000564 [Malus domestica]
MPKSDRWDACLARPISSFHEHCSHLGGGSLGVKFTYNHPNGFPIIDGVTAGISGFTGLTRFIFYFFIMTVISVGLIAKTGFTVYSYFDSWSQIRLNGFLGGLSSFVLFWTVTYDIVHIF